MIEFILLLWVADVVSNLGMLAVLYWLVFSFVSCFCWVGADFGDVSLEVRDKILKVGSIVGVCLTLFTTILPSKQTLYIAAAAYATNTALHTNAGEKLIKAFEKKVDEYTGEEGGEDE